MTFAKIKFSLPSGLLVFLTVNTLSLGLQRGEATVVIPIANLSFMLVLVASIALRMEKLTVRKGLALV